jgi:hypothetical protein
LFPDEPAKKAHKRSREAPSFVARPICSKLLRPFWVPPAVECVKDDFWADFLVYVEDKHRYGRNDGQFATNCCSGALSLLQTA